MHGSKGIRPTYITKKSLTARWISKKSEAGGAQLVFGRGKSRKDVGHLGTLRRIDPNQRDGRNMAKTNP